MSLYTKVAGGLSTAKTKVTGGLSYLKALLPDQIRFPGRSLVFFNFNRATDDEMARDVGDGTSSDVLMTPIRWLQRSMIEAPLIARDQAGDPLEKSNLVALLNKPNPEYSREVLFAGTVLSLGLDGNAYWLIARNANGKPVELWYAPHPNVEPKWPAEKNDVFISHYEYNFAGGKKDLEPEDVIHFREGVDLDNIRKGLSPLKGLLREIWTDNEAAAFTGALLKNSGIPGVVVSPADKDVTLLKDEAQAVEARIESKFTRSGRGKPLVMTGATKVEQFGFSPKELDLSPLRDVAEERVTAALGVQAAVVGFGSGLQQTKVGATMRELRQLSWFNGVIPMQGLIAGEISRSLGPAFNVDAVRFDNTGVEALRENEDTKAARLERLYRGGVITRAEARTPLALESVPADEVYSVSLTQTFIPQGQAAPEISDNGGGKAAPRADYFLTAGGVLVHKLHAGHSATEERIIAAAPRAEPPAIAARMARRMDRIRRRAPAILEPGLQRVFEDLGRAALVAARAELSELELVADPQNPEVKQGETEAALAELEQIVAARDAALLAKLMDAIDVETMQRAMTEALEQGFLEVSAQVSEATSVTFGIEFELDDVAQRTVMRAGGLRAGLIDLDQQTRDAIFDALASGRAEGLAGDGLARHIAEFVEGGPWRDARTRALVIARTEGAHAANVSTLEAARGMPETEHVQIFDDRLGQGDEECAAPGGADGRVVTIQEAEAMGLAHPNCTRSFVPINALLMEEMGL